MADSGDQSELQAIIQEFPYKEKKGFKTSQNLFNQFKAISAYEHTEWKDGECYHFFFFFFLLLIQRTKTSTVASEVYLTVYLNSFIHLFHPFRDYGKSRRELTETALIGLERGCLVL